MTWGDRTDNDSALKILFGEGRRLFANHFFIQADVTFHSGYYPSIFDQAHRPKASPMVSTHTGTEEHDHDAHPSTTGVASEAESAHEQEMSFLHKPKDWIERFGRHFMITKHTHLSGGKVAEILPWLRLSADLDPQQVETYTVAAYWLRRLGKIKDAEDFLREGLRNNPNSYEILFSLGRLFYENEHDAERARNLWEQALRKWTAQESGKKNPDLLMLEEISVHLARLEEQRQNYSRAIGLLELGKKASPNAASLEKEIAELKAKLASHPAPN